MQNANMDDMHLQQLCPASKDVTGITVAKVSYQLRWRGGHAGAVSWPSPFHMDLGARLSISLPDANRRRPSRSNALGTRKPARRALFHPPHPRLAGPKD